MIELSLRQIHQRHLDTNYMAWGVDWFAKDATRFFRSRYPKHGYKAGLRAFFVTSEQFDSRSPRCYNIRVMDWQTGRIDTLGDFQQYKTRAKAHRTMFRIIQRLERLSSRSMS